MQTKPHFKKFRISELIQYLFDVTTVCTNADAEQLQISEQVSATLLVAQKLNSAFNSPQGSQISSEIIDLDLRRDNCLVGIRTCAEGLTYHFDETIRNAALAVLKSIDSYGSGLTRLNYQAETRVIESLSRDWKNDSKLASAMTILNMSVWTTELETANALFNARYLARVGEQAANTQEAASNMRKEAIGNYTELANHIEARDRLSKDGIYTSLMNKLDILTNKYNLLVDSRKSSSKEKEDTSSTNATTSDPAS